MAEEKKKKRKAPSGNELTGYGDVEIMAPTKQVSFKDFGLSDPEDYARDMPIEPTSTTPDFTGGLASEKRYPEQMGISTTGGGGREMRTTYSLDGNTMSIKGGHKGFGNRTPSTGIRNASTMSPGIAGGRSARRPGYAEYQSPAEKAAARAAARGGNNPLEGLITRDQAKEMGLGVNQWRELNSQLLKNKGGLQEQSAENTGAMDIANTKVQGALTERGMMNNAPEAKARTQAILEETKSAPQLRKLMDFRLNSLMSGGKKDGKGANYQDTVDLLDEYFTRAGLQSLTDKRN